MAGLLKSDFYKLSKMKSFPICIIISLGLAIGSVLMLNYTQQIVDLGLGEFTASNSLASTFSGNGTLFAAIVVSIFAASEFGFGTIKNTASRGFSRVNIYLSKLTVSFIISIVLMLVYSLAYTATATAVWGFGEVAADYWPRILTIFGLEVLLNLAYTALFVMISMLVRQTGGAIAINICIMQFSMLIVNLIETALKYFFKVEITLTDYLISTNMSYLAGFTDTLEQSLVTRSLLVGVIYFVVLTAFGLFTFQKRDIK